MARATWCCLKALVFVGAPLAASSAWALPAARDMGYSPEVQETFEAETLGAMPSRWARYTGSGGCCLNYDAHWQVTQVSVPEGGVTRALSATQDSGEPGVNLSWCVYHGTTATISDGVIPSTARYYVEALLHPRGVAQPEAEQEQTLQPYFVDGYTYDEVMLLSYDEGDTWEVAVFQFYQGQWSKPLSYAISETGFGWWGRVGMEIERTSGLAWIYYNGEEIGGPIYLSAVNTTDTVRSNVRATNNLLDADDFRIYLVGSDLPPSVTGVTPAAGATDVSTSVSPTATFSEAMDEETITTATFLLQDGGGTPVAGVVGYNAATRTATFNPDDDLASLSTYTATIVAGESGVKDLSATPMGADYVWSFTTEPCEPGLDSAAVDPSGGNACTAFTWRVRYSSPRNAPPDEVWLAIWSANAGLSWRSMTAEDPSDTTYTDGAWFAYSACLAGGAHAFRCAARAGAEWAYAPLPAGSYVSGPGVNPVLLSSGYVYPSSGPSATEFRWRIKYWNTLNRAPDAVWVAIWYPALRSACWHRMWALDSSDTDYSDGAWYTFSHRWLSEGSYAYRFAARQGGWWVYWPEPAGCYVLGPAVGP